MQQVQKNALFKKSLESQALKDKANYKNYKRTYEKVIRTAKYMYYESEMASAVGNPRKTWNLANDIIGRTKKKEVVTSHSKVNGKSVSDPIKIAEEFNSYFTTVATKIKQELPSPGKCYKTYLQKIEKPKEKLKF